MPPENYSHAATNKSDVEFAIPIDIGRLQVEGRPGELNGLRFRKIHSGAVAESDVQCAGSTTRKSGLGLVAGDLSQINFAVVIKVSHGERAGVGPAEPDYARVLECPIAIVKEHVCRVMKYVRHHHVEPAIAVNVGAL